MRKVNDYDAGASFLDARAEEQEPLATSDEPEWLSGDDLADNAKAPEFLINNILETNSNGLMSGSSQAFKTFCVLKMAHSVCTGQDFFGYSVFTQGKVLYICGEGKGALARRIKALKIVEGDFNGNLFVLDKPIGIDDIKCMDWLRESIEKINPVFVIFDTFSSLASATNENDNSEVSRALRLVSLACDHENTCSIVIHHYGKDATRGSRGAYAFTGNVDFEFSMERVTETMNTVLSCKKMKDGDHFKDINLLAHVVELGLIRQDGVTSSSLILKASLDNHLPQNQQKALDAIKSAIILDGTDMDDGRCCLSEGQVRKCLSLAFKDTVNRFKAFNEQIPPLTAKGIIKTDGEYFWF
jgi:hypothetical protein